MLTGFHAQNDVVQYGEALHKFEMLVYHADSQGVCVIGVTDADGLTVLADFTLLRLVQSEKDTHQGRLSGTVLPEQSVNFPAL